MKTPFFLVGLFLTSTLFGRTWPEIKQSGELIAGLDAASPPYNFYKGSQLTGVEIDLVERVAKNLGVKVTYKVSPFNSLIVGLNQGKYDVVISGHAITPERSKQVTFLSPIYCSHDILVSKKGGPKTAAEMKGKTIAVPVGTTYYERAKQIPGIGNVKTLPSETDALAALLAGRADAWLSDDSIAEHSRAAHPELQLGESLYESRCAWMVSPQNSALRDELDREIKKSLSDGSYLSISKKHTRKDVRCP